MPATVLAQPNGTVEPWEHPVAGASLADEVSAELARHVVFKTPEQADALALWTLGTYLMDVWALWPKVLISSPEKRCGKTVLVETLEAHVARGFLVSNITAAGLFRVVEEAAPTILIDEADRFLRRNEEANGIINAGHRRRTATVVRVEERGGEHVVRRFSVWGAQVIAGIGTQEETLVDRSVRVALRRRLRSETVEKLSARYFEDRHRARRQLARRAEDNRIEIGASKIEAPPCGNDRAQDNWTPLFRVAAVLGGDWPDRCARAYAAIEQTDDGEDRETIGVRLLRDIGEHHGAPYRAHGLQVALRPPARHRGCAVGRVPAARLSHHDAPGRRHSAQLRGAPAAGPSRLLLRPSRCAPGAGKVWFSGRGQNICHRLPKCQRGKCRHRKIQ
jgi:putative DNA primase/helicase